MRIRLACRSLVSSLGFLGLLFCFSSAAHAQDTSVTDQGTPSMLERGAHPLGSFGGGDIDTVNLFNGNLALRVPLAGKDGRAGMSVSFSLAYNSKIWRTVGSPDGTGGTLAMAVLDPWESQAGEIARGWILSPGRMTARQSGSGTTHSVPCPNAPFSTVYDQALTVLTFTSPDGTEYEFRDAKYDGRFRPYASICSGETRGQKWYTTDGTAATFVSDADDIKDNPKVTYGTVTVQHMVR